MRSYINRIISIILLSSKNRNALISPLHYWQKSQNHNSYFGIQEYKLQGYLGAMCPASSYWLTTPLLIQTCSRPLCRMCALLWCVRPYLTTLESLQMMCSWNMSLLSTLSTSLRGTCRGRQV